MRKKQIWLKELKVMVDVFYIRMDAADACGVNKGRRILVLD